jgi:hypothetical protein
LRNKQDTGLNFRKNSVKIQPATIMEMIRVLNKIMIIIICVFNEFSLGTTGTRNTNPRRFALCRQNRFQNHYFIVQFNMEIVFMHNIF